MTTGKIRSFGSGNGSGAPRSQASGTEATTSATSRPRKVIEPTVKAANSTPPDPSKLPPIERVIQPKMQHTSTKIRWYLGLGYEVGEIARFMGVRYQQVRNVGVTDPKRAAREDVPPYEIKLHPLPDDIESIMDAELERSLLAGRLEEKEVRKRSKGED